MSSYTPVDREYSPTPTEETEEQNLKPERHFEDPREHRPHIISDEEWKAKVYRKLYAILTIMSLALVGINILQVTLLPYMANLYWVVLFPLVVFLCFMIWATLIVVLNFPAFSTRDANAAAGFTNAGWHLRSLLSLRVDPTKGCEPAKGDGKNWPRRFTRAGIMLTMMLNVILTEFIYLPAFALQDFKKKEWDVSLNVTSPPTTPAVVIFQNLNDTLHNRAILPTDDEVWQNLCDDIDDDPNPYHSCVANYTTTVQKPTRFGKAAVETHLRYAIFRPQEPFLTIPVYQGMDFFYQFSYNSSAGNIITDVAFLDPALVDDFPTAYQCGINSITLLATSKFQQISLRPTRIIDEINVMGREDICSSPAFNQYQGYELSIVDWGDQPAIGTYGGCDIANPDNQVGNGFCRALIQIVFPTPLTTIYKSRHGKDWITILTEEGGVVGFVTFLTWFFGIFEAL